MLTKTRAIVLRQVRYGDQSLIVDMFTEALGRLSFSVRLPKTSRGRLKKQFFQPLTLVEVELDHRERLPLQRISNIRIDTPYYNIATDAAKLAEALFLAEFLHYATRSEQQNRPLFAFITTSLLWLDAATEGFANFHLVFLMRLTRFVGFYPNLDDYTERSCFDLREARFTRFTPTHPDFLQPQEAALVVTLMRLSLPTMHLLRINRTQRNRITDILIHFYRLHVPEMPELQSLAVLHELF